MGKVTKEAPRRSRKTSKAETAVPVAAAAYARPFGQEPSVGSASHAYEQGSYHLGALEFSRVKEWLSKYSPNWPMPTEAPEFHFIMMITQSSGLLNLARKGLLEPAQKTHYAGLARAMEQVQEQIRLIGNTDLDQLVELLVASPTLDTDSIEQARLHANERRRLIQLVTLLPASEFAQLIPALDTESNKSRALGRWAQNHKILAVRVANEMRYPAVQVNPQTAEPYPELQPVLTRAAKQGYTDWEILSWLVRPFRIVDDTPGDIPEEMIAGLSLQGLVDAVKSYAGDTPEAPISTPIAALIEGDAPAFYRMANAWLGSADVR